jgi:hypothetical protein
LRESQWTGKDSSVCGGRVGGADEDTVTKLSRRMATETWMGGPGQGECVKPKYEIVE